MIIALSIPIQPRHMTRIAVLLALIAACLLMLRSALAAGDDYLLGTGDRLRIVVQGQPELSTEAQIRPPGMLSLSFLGTLPAAGMTPDALEQAIATRLGRKTGPDGCCVSVEIIEYRPFFVLGDVRASGSYPWVPGITVLHALAIAGGLGTATDGFRISTEAEIYRARERLDLLLDSLGAALARRARLEAERDGLATIRFPDELTHLLGPRRAAVIRAGEESLLKERERVLYSEIAAQVQAKPVFEEEIKAHLAQIDVNRQQMKLYSEEIAEFSGVEGRLVPKTLLMNLQRQRIQAEGDIRELEAFIARARNQILQVEQVILKLRNARRIEITASLKDVEDELERNRNSLEEVRRFLVSAGSVEAALTSQPSRMTEESVTIARLTANGLEEIVADGYTPVLPGDLVRVPLQASLQTAVKRTSP